MKFVAGCKCLWPNGRDDVEVPAAQPVLILYLVARPHCGRNTEAIQGWLIEEENALEAGAFGEKFNGIGLAGLDVHQLLVAHLITGLLEKPQGLAQIVAHRLRISVDRIRIGFGENFWRNLVADGFKQFELPAGW